MNVSGVNHPYAYSYLVTETLVSSKPGIDFRTDMLPDGRSVADFMKEKLKEFSEMSKASLSNAKEVDLSSINIGERSISFVLYSMEELPILGRSLRIFSQLLLEADYFRELFIRNRLFTTLLPSESPAEDAESKKRADAARVSDTDLVAGLVKLLPLSESSLGARRRRAIEDMKALALRSGILQLP